MLHALKNLVYGKFALPELLLAGTVVCSAMPIANAMVASGGDTGTHHYAATYDVAEIWNRTVYIGTENSGGTGTYLGQSADGRCWVLTAAHVSVGAMSVATTSTSSFSLTTTGDVVEITNSDGTAADLKLVAVNKNSEYTSFLEGQEYANSIGIYSGSLTTTTPLYTVGTGKSSAIGFGISSGTRQKEWAGFTADTDSATSVSTSTTWVTPCYVELFQSEKTGFQACTYDSGSGVFIYGGAETGWQVVGVNLAVAGYNGTKFVSSLGNIGYMENASENNILTCSTFFANLSPYAEQINAVMAIPEPSAFGCLAGTFALALAASSRRRRA